MRGAVMVRKISSALGDEAIGALEVSLWGMPALPCPPFFFFPLKWLPNLSFRDLVFLCSKTVPGADGSVALGADCQLWAASCSRCSGTEQMLQPALLQYLSYLTEDCRDCCCSGTHREGGGNNMQLLILWCSVLHASILSVMTLVVSPCPSSPGGCGSSACAWSSKLVFHFALLQVYGICIMMAPAVLCQLKVINMLVTDKQPHIARK